MNAIQEWRANVILDPWCLVEFADNTEALFGFAIKNNATGGLAWMRSSPVEWMAEDGSRARTMTGRRYSLGRRITVGELPSEEATYAFAIMMTPRLADPRLAPAITVDLAIAVWWVAACKMARHLRSDAPPLRDPKATRKFIAANLRRYLSRPGRRLL
ncbi:MULTISPECIES: hypothetical protein [Roseomonadaceae]|uniref:SRPBCC family protein n=1 Tax=Falsiroseomonas oleicola TaxID=2801474 RepID=A0ABS6HE42_9PROT|nr:hypothetical protein [Roseomonas oleicola]MBU8546087.1 hypothetical protein [Roseomonas oleicola]